MLGIELQNQAIENENLCYYNLCDVDNETSPSYHHKYQEEDGICYCFNEYNEIIKQTYLG